MSRTLILLIAVLLLGAGAFFVLSGSKEEANLSDKSESRQFAYDRLEDIHRIFIADKNGRQVTLTRGGVSGWMADGRPANANIMKNILETVERVDIQSLPSFKAVPHMIEDLATSGILVQLFDENDTKLRGYYIGGSTNNETGTFAIKEGVEDPYIIHLPGFTGNIRQRFIHWGDEWRDKVYWRVDPDKVESFSIEYPKQRNNSFVLTRQENTFQLRPYYESGQQTRNIPKGGVEGILSRYEKYYVNSFQNEDSKIINKAKSVLPFATIRIKEEGKEEQTMVIYPRFQDDLLDDDATTSEVLNAGELTAYSAFINGGNDWVLLNVETLQPLLVGYDYF